MKDSFPIDATIGDLYHPAMKITDQAEADKYLERLIRYGMAHGQTRKEATRIQLSNLGYFAGYYDDKTMSRVYRLFRTRHPIFGGAHPSAEEAFDAGVKMAEGGQR